jgi:hypothetical protein
MEADPTDLSMAPETATVAAGTSPLELIEGELDRPQISFLYQVGLIVVALGMVLLPPIYLALITLFGY